MTPTFFSLPQWTRLNLPHHSSDFSRFSVSALPWLGRLMTLGIHPFSAFDCPRRTIDSYQAGLIEMNLPRNLSKGLSWVRSRLELGWSKLGNPNLPQLASLDPS